MRCLTLVAVHIGATTQATQESDKQANGGLARVEARLAALDPAAAAETPVNPAALSREDVENFVNVRGEAGKPVPR